MLCPRCGKPMALMSYTDWDNLTTHYYLDSADISSILDNNSNVCDRSRTGMDK